MQSRVDAWWRERQRFVLARARCFVTGGDVPEDYSKTYMLYPVLPVRVHPSWCPCAPSAAWEPGHPSSPACEPQPGTSQRILHTTERCRCTVSPETVLVVAAQERCIWSGGASKRGPIRFTPCDPYTLEPPLLCSAAVCWILLHCALSTRGRTVRIVEVLRFLWSPCRSSLNCAAAASCHQ